MIDVRLASPMDQNADKNPASIASNSSLQSYQSLQYHRTNPQRSRSASSESSQQQSHERYVVDDGIAANNKSTSMTSDSSLESHQSQRTLLEGDHSASSHQHSQRQCVDDDHIPTQLANHIDSYLDRSLVDACPIDVSFVSMGIDAC